MSRRTSIALAAVLVLLVAYSVWWAATARLVAQRANGWIAEQARQGNAITPSQVGVGGYPLAFSITADDAKLAATSGFGFNAQKLKLWARPWSPHRFAVRITGGFGFDLPPGGARPPITIAGETLRGGARFGDTALPLDLSLAADSVSAARTAPEEQTRRELIASTVELTASRPEAPAAAATDEALSAKLRLLDLTGEALEENPLGNTITETVFQAKAMGPLPASWDPDGLKAWRDAGGTLEIANLMLRWGPLTLKAEGTAALDSAMQPEGAFTAHLTGFDRAIDALAAAHWIKPGPAGVSKLALGVTAHPGADGQPVVDTPLTIQNRRISAGPIKLGEVPALTLD